MVILQYFMKKIEKVTIYARTTVYKKRRNKDGN